MMNWSWLGNLTKPFANVLNPVTERFGKWLGKRKPRLYVHPTLGQSIWSIATQGAPNSLIEMMHMVFWADLNHDDDTQTLLIISAYPKGTQLQIPSIIGRLRIPPHRMMHEQISAFVSPIKAKRGEPFKCKFILVDQFQRKYTTQEISFKWVGPVASPPTP
jgi:hypothetical protein